MNIKHSMLALSMMLAARFAPKPSESIRGTGAFDPVLDVPPTEAPPKPRSEPRRSGRNVVRALARQGRSTGMPHQGSREAARRRGGEEWEAYKAADRARRGLEG